MNNLFYIYSVLYFYSCVFALGVWYTAFLSNHTSFNHRDVVVFLVCIHLRSIDLRRICEKRSSTEKPRWQDAGQLFTFSLRLLTTEKLPVHPMMISMVIILLSYLRNNWSVQGFFSLCTTRSMKPHLTDKRWPSAMQVRRNYFRSWRWGKIMNKKIAKVEEKEKLKREKSVHECSLRGLHWGRRRRKKSLSGRGSSNVGRVEKCQFLY